MMNLKLTAAMAALSLALAPAAFAQEQEEVSGFYIGGGAGQFNAQQSTTSMTSTRQWIAGMRTTPRTSSLRATA